MAGRSGAEGVPLRKSVAMNLRSKLFLAVDHRQRGKFSGMEWCCSGMILGLEESAIVYRDQMRLFGLNSTGDPLWPLAIDYCPFCGIKLPRHLIEEWNTLLDELGLTEELTKDEADRNIPAEMNTGEWWKKRGL